MSTPKDTSATADAEFESATAGVMTSVRFIETLAIGRRVDIRLTGSKVHSDTFAESATTASAAELPSATVDGLLR
jgi:hypothetical protein